jgi:hypothetical protein
MLYHKIIVVLLRDSAIEVSEKDELRFVLRARRSGSHAAAIFGKSGAEVTAIILVWNSCKVVTSLLK